MKPSPVHRLHDEIAIVGWACRLPGANSIDELWSLLVEGRCAVTTVPEDRFFLERFGHPRRQERGKSYTWAAGILDDVWGFDPAVFGISPREAVQLDPQQRILLQLTWEALEDAGIRPSALAGSDAGVYVGASQVDYGHAFFTDPSVADAQFAPGTALAVLANRISYAYGLHGPSISVDTACSSSLVALNQAMEALRSGRVDTAIVAGSNLIASPAPFIAFSQANMLSPTGLCQTFSAAADGFTRAEGAAVLVLRKSAYAQASGNPVRGIVVATDVNSDGRTNGITLPSVEAQEALLRRVYEHNGIDRNRLAFIEAHGTGTPVGDPIEATAIGRTVGQERSTPLPIGSIKTNIGHLEPASGLAGLLKAILALNHGLLPPSLHFDEPNPHIDFDALNLTVCTKPLLLPKSGEQLAGVNAFGFGGTNAHAIVAAGRKVAPPVSDGARGRKVFALSADSRGALVELARDYAERVAHLSCDDVATMAGGIVHRRERMSNRLVISSTSGEEVAGALEAFVSGSDHPKLVTGSAVGDELPVAFVFSGNGGQWVGMGQAAYRHSDAFRTRFEQADAYFAAIGGWSLKDALFSEDLGERLPLTSVAQPLIFAIQAASTAALRAGGLEPAAVFGHSVGEVAAAEAAGILDLRTAIEVIHARSMQQERVKDAGGMAAVLASAEMTESLLDEIEGVEIAAINSPRAVTVAGPVPELAAFMRLAKERGIATLDLDLAYPFHTELMNPMEEPLLAELADIEARDAAVPFISTVTGACLPGSRLDGHYWWRNVREPVRFETAVQAAAELGARYFVEIGPRPTLLKHVSESLRGRVNGFLAQGVLDRSDDESDPFEKARARAIAAGADVDLEKIFGLDPGPGVALPRYPWQQVEYRLSPTTEAVGADPVQHVFAGARDRSDALVWRSHIDPMLHPALDDHKVGEQTFFPGTGFLEIALAVGRQWLQTESVVLTDIEIVSPLDLTSGETREVTTRVSPGSGTVEILSRPRLSQVNWLLHSRFKVQTGHAVTAVTVPSVSATRHLLPGAAIYDIADACGLHYGPSFRLVTEVAVHDDGLISVELTQPRDEASFVLDPMRLDSAAHGFFTLFPELNAEERGVAYIPVRLEEVALYRPYVAPARALIEITAKSERAIVGNCFVYGSDGEIVAVLRGVRSQPITLRRTGSLASSAFVEVPRLVDGAALSNTGVSLAAEDIASAAESLGLVRDDADSSSDSEMLLEGWATVAAYEIASGLGDEGLVDVDAMVASGRLPEELRSWLVNILARLEAADLAMRDDETWRLVDDPLLPTSASVVRALATEQPSRAAETLLAAAVSGFAGDVADDGETISPEGVVPKAVRDFYISTDVGAREASEALEDLLLSNEGLWPGNRALRVLLVGFAPLARTLMASGQDVVLTVYEPDRRRYEIADLALSRTPGVRLLDAERVGELAEYDLVVAISGLHRLGGTLDLTALAGTLAADGVLVAVEPKPSLFKDIVLGVDPDWFGAGGRPASPLQPEGHWAAELEDAGFTDVQVSGMRCGSTCSHLIVADAAPVRNDAEPAGALEPATADAKARRALVVADATDSDLARELGARLGEGETSTSTVVTLSDYPDVAHDVVVMIPGPTGTGDPVAALTRRCLEMRDCAAKVDGSSAQLWLVFSGALQVGSAQVDPMETGAWAFSRTLANEHPKVDVRRIDVAPHVSPSQAGEHISRVIASGTRETELHLDGEAVRAVRVRGLERALEPTSSSRQNAARLERRAATGERLVWQPVRRRRPKSTEIEVEVEAVGLNFRDLMWSMSLLPEDMLEDGFSGAALGLECAGRVARIGSDVTDVEVGDKVMAFAGSSFATHVTIDAGQAVRLPEGVSCEGAATIPVAFFTAYWSLVTQAKLARREWVLIHGGAGGVGMAAVQIAQSRGARVIATAGSPAKRELLRALGVVHVLDSRSTDFVEQVRDITGGGVDVVLNSLAGEAMERSIDCLRPFGRFVELGKRDYAVNTHIGLRPFRRNLSYFGVDVDQVIGVRKAQADRVFARIVKGFETGKFVPLPHSVFDADSVATAFHLMQLSGHVGKIVVRPPTRSMAAPARKPLKVSSRGTHLVTGAFGGFGLETAKWLVDQGARHLVLVGRRGPSTPEAEAALQDFTDRGVKVMAEPCDVTDRHALEALLEAVHATMPPIVGVMHEAMVLDDGILANLDEERFHRVLGPKVIGAENLDRLVRGEKLDYFVLFSSVTTLVGNPGQGNYVAANAYMEGLARRRRRKGLPAVAIGWGPISDVGVVAQSERLQSGLEKLTGVTGMRAREALALMAKALEESTAVPETAVITITPSDGSYAADRLAVLRSPTYEAFVSAGGRRGEGGGETIDIKALAAEIGVEAARQRVVDVISAELAQVLHLREEEVSQTRPLGEIGLDSLMGLELLMQLEECFGIRAPLSGSSGAMTVTDIADEIMAFVGLGRDRDAAMAATLAVQHHGEVEPGQLEALKDFVSEEAHKTKTKRLLA